MRFVLFFILALSLSGCVSQRAVLVNERGEQLTCEAYGYGLFASMLASDKQEQCVADAGNRGYRLKEKRSKTEVK